MLIYWYSLASNEYVLQINMCCNRSAGIDKTLFVCQLFCLNICQVYLFDGWTSCASSVFIAIDEIRSHFCWIESLREITIFDRVSVGSNHHFPWAFPVRNRKIPGFFPKFARRSSSPSLPRVCGAATCVSVAGGWHQRPRGCGWTLVMLTSITGWVPANYKCWFISPSKYDMYIYIYIIYISLYICVFIYIYIYIIYIYKYHIHSYLLLL